MRRLELDRGWRFHLGDIPDGIWRAELDDSSWRTVDLPHDWSIELERDPASPSGPAGGNFPTGVGWYQRRFPVTRDLREGTLLVEFEGVYMNAEVWLDEHFLGRHPYGYTSFAYDLTPHLDARDEHVLRVMVDNSNQPNSRWYSGSGIYRHVWLWTGHRVHVGPHDVSVTTPDVSTDGATVRVTTSVANDTEADEVVTVRSRVVSPRGRTADSVDEAETIPAGGRLEYTQELFVGRPKLWSPEEPNLYRLETEILLGRELVDAASTPFGIRSIEVDAQAGLRLNGEPIELRGGCVHHDNGPLGAAAYDRAEERKVELLAANGFNAVRCAHNPPAPAFLDACDRLGMLVIDEAFDCWRNGKSLADYHVTFDDWWRRDLESMIARDRNHPSVIMWSIGNEVVERGNAEGRRLAHVLADHVRSVDPARPVTAGVNGSHTGSPWEELDTFFSALDVCGYNYAEHQYRADRERVPDRVVYGSESMALDAARHWASVQELDNVVGDFVWTALDYLGESGIGRVHFEGDGAAHQGDYPWHQANCGDLDLCGFKRPQSFHRDAVWRRGRPLFIAVHAPVGAELTPTVTRWGWPDVRPSWTWPGHEGRRFRVDVYTAGDTVELFLDGELLGTSRAEGCVATFDVPYAPGTLRAVGSDGATCEVSTASEPVRIRLTPDRDRIARGPGDLSFVTVEIVDADGSVHPDADRAVTFTVTGEGAIAAVGNGDPRSTEKYVGDRRSAYRGRCLVVLKSLGVRGEIRLRAQAAGLEPADATIGVA
ncbi:MAG: glycoside hydrolase family 2 TIM barrel-domain containing protein [Gaiellaceae bacterium]